MMPVRAYLRVLERAELASNPSFKNNDCVISMSRAHNMRPRSDPGAAPSPHLSEITIEPMGLAFSPARQLRAS